MTPTVIIEETENTRYPYLRHPVKERLWRWYLAWPDGVKSAKSLGFESRGNARLNALKATGLTDFIERYL